MRMMIPKKREISGTAVLYIVSTNRVGLTDSVHQRPLIIAPRPSGATRVRPLVAMGSLSDAPRIADPSTPIESETARHYLYPAQWSSPRVRFGLNYLLDGL